MSQQREVKLTWKALSVAYNVDYKTVAELAADYGITWTEMKTALHEFGFTVRRGEARPDEPGSDYTINLVDDRPEGAKKAVKAPIVKSNMPTISSPTEIPTIEPQTA